MENAKKQQIQADYNKIKSFSNGELQQLADKHKISIDELFEIIEL